MGILDHFPTEKLILHKSSGEEVELVALVGNNGIQSEDISVPIEVNDYFERKLPNGVIEYYQVINPGFHIETPGIPAHYQTKVKQIIVPIVYENDDERNKMIFISHSSKDKEYTKAFVDLLFAIGLNEDDIVCSSYPGLGVPLRASVYEWLVEKFQKYDLHVLYFLSHNYYSSAASLNEMGAAWAMKQKWDGILLPDFSFANITGCIDPYKIGIKLDGDLDELKHRLGELKDDIIVEFGLRAVSATRWEKIRDDFLHSIKNINISEGTESYSQILTYDNSELISKYAFVMLMYASDYDGQIIVSRSTYSTSFQAGKVKMERNQTSQEIALWYDVLEFLQKNSFIINVNSNDNLFKLTSAGHNVAKRFKDDNSINSEMLPEDVLNIIDAQK